MIEVKAIELIGESTSEFLVPKKDGNLKVVAIENTNNGSWVEVIIDNDKSLVENLKIEIIKKVPDDY